MVVFFVKSNENTYPQGRALMQMYRVVPITNRWNSCTRMSFNVWLFVCLWHCLEHVLYQFL